MGVAWRKDSPGTAWDVYLEKKRGLASSVKGRGKEGRGMKKKKRTEILFAAFYLSTLQIPCYLAVSQNSTCSGARKGKWYHQIFSRS